MPADDIGSFSPVDPKEFLELRAIFEDDLAAHIHIVRTEVAALEEGLASPPSEATEEDIRQTLSDWDQARQWLEAYEAELLRKRKIAALKVSLTLAQAGRATAESHSDMALMDQWEEDVLNQLDALEGVDEEECGCCYRR